MTAGYRKGKLVEVELVDIGNGQSLAKEAGEAFIRMHAAATIDGIRLVPNSGFRPHGKQWVLWERYRERLREWEEIPVGRKPTPVAQPGWSEHESGDAVDINRAPGDDPATDAPDSPVDIWLAAHAGEYGFVRTVASEPWHWSYRPKTVAPLSVA